MFALYYTEYQLHLQKISTVLFIVIKITRSACDAIRLTIAGQQLVLII
jgi:hypothetical protein